MTEYQAETQSGRRTLLDELVSFAILVTAVSLFCWALIYEVQNDLGSAPATSTAGTNQPAVMHTQP